MLLNKSLQDRLKVFLKNYSKLFCKKFLNYPALKFEEIVDNSTIKSFDKLLNSFKLTYAGVPPKLITTTIASLPSSSL